MISHSVMEVMDGMRYQILTQLKKSRLIPYKDHRKVNENQNNWLLVNAALAMGAYPNIARYDTEALQLRTMKEAKVRFHPSCDILSNHGRDTARGGKVSASANVKAVTRNSNTDWFIFDEMTKSGRVAMIKGVTPVPSICVAMFSGQISTSKMCSFEEEESNSLFVELSDSWLCFESKFACLDYMLELRHKWFAYFLQMLNKPGNFLEQEYEDLIGLFVEILQINCKDPSLMVQKDKKPKNHFFRDARHGGRQNQSHYH